MQYTFSHFAFFFILYSTVGWCGEVILATYTQRKFVNRGFLNGPVCPIYGVGGNIVIICLTPFLDSLPMLFFGSLLLTTLLELVGGWLLEKFFHQKWWDYKDEVLNFKGYICIRFSILWGLACTLVMKLVHPLVMRLYGVIPQPVFLPMFITYYSVFTIDLIITVADLAKIRAIVVATNDLDHILNKISEIVGKGLSDGTLKTLENYDRQKELFDARMEKLGLPEKLEAGMERLVKGERFEAEKARLASFKAKYESAYRAVFNKVAEHFGNRYEEEQPKLSFVQRRLAKAYPNLHIDIAGNFKERFNRLKDWAARVKDLFDQDDDDADKE